MFIVIGSVRILVLMINGSYNGVNVMSVIFFCKGNIVNDLVELKLDEVFVVFVVCGRFLLMIGGLIFWMIWLIL